MSLSPELTALLNAKSMIRYLPPNGTPGLARTWDRIESRSPSPPARMSVRTDGTRRFYGPSSATMDAGQVPAHVGDGAGQGRDREEGEGNAATSARGSRCRRSGLGRAGLAMFGRREAKAKGAGRPRRARVARVGRRRWVRGRDLGAAQRGEAALTWDRRDRVLQL